MLAGGHAFEPIQGFVGGQAFEPVQGIGEGQALVQGPSNDQILEPLVQGPSQDQLLEAQGKMLKYGDICKKKTISSMTITELKSK